MADTEQRHPFIYPRMETEPDTDSTAVAGEGAGTSTSTALQLHKALDEGVQVMVEVLADCRVMDLPRRERMRAFAWLSEQASRIGPGGGR